MTHGCVGDAVRGRIRACPPTPPSPPRSPARPASPCSSCAPASAPSTDEVRRRELMDAGDRLAQQILSDRLTAERPGDAVLSEEATDSEARLGADRVWIIDPLDGTDEYGQGRTDFAVHVALWQRSAGAAGGAHRRGRGRARPRRAVAHRPAAAGPPAAVEPAAADRGLPIPAAGGPEPPARGRLGRPRRGGDHLAGHRGGQRRAPWGPSSARSWPGAPRPTCTPAA